MALLHIESFDWLAAASSVNSTNWIKSRYAGTTGGSTGYITEDGVQTGSKAISYLDSSGCSFTIPFTGASTIVHGGHHKVPALFATGLFNLVESGTIHLQVALTAAGELRVLRAGSTQIGITSGLGLAIDTWYHIEVKAYCHDSAGTVDLYVDGVLELSLTGQDTRNGGTGVFNGILFSSSIFPYRKHLDNLYVLNTTGSLNNDILGVQYARVMRPTADASPNDWAPLSGSDHYAAVSEDTGSSDTNVLDDSVTGQQELFDLSNPVGVTNIKGVVPVVIGRLTDGTGYSIKHVLKSGGTTETDAAQSFSSTSYVSKQQVHEVDPDTSAAWLDADVDALQAGFEVG